MGTLNFEALLGHCRRESGPVHVQWTQWAIDVRNQCVEAAMAFFFKQWGGRTPKAGGRLLEGREWNQFPREALTSRPDTNQGVARDGGSLQI